nr:hypothetical protein [Tanacetum cinerariifolium]
MLDNGTIDEYGAKLSGIPFKSATLGEVMSEHKLVKKFLTSLPRRFVHIVAALEQVLDLKTTGFEDVVGRLKAYKERVKEEDKANDPQVNLLYAKTEYSNGNNDSSGARGRSSYSRGHGRGRGQGPGRDNSQNQSQRDSSKNREENEKKGKQHEKSDLSHIHCYRCDQYEHFVSKCLERSRNHEVNLNEAQEKGVYHEEGNYSYFSELNENINGRIRFGDGSCVSMKGKGSILFQCKNGEQKLLKDVCYIPALRSNVISLGQATISGYDISIRGDFLTMRDSWGSLLIKVPRSANRLYKAQLNVGKEGTNEVGRESDEKVNPHSNLVTIHDTVLETSPENEEDKSGSDDMSIPIAQLETIRLLIALAAGRGWKIHHLDVKTAFLNGDRKKLDSTLKEMGFLQCVQDKAVYRKVSNEEFIIIAVYGDDIFVTGTSLDLINKFKKRMVSQFEMSDPGELTYYLGIEVSQRKDCVEIKQERYARKILKEAGMEDCNLALCLMEPGLKLSKAEDEPEVEVTRYRKMHYWTCFLPCTTGHVFHLGTSPITWCSQKQTTVALSSCEAEFMAATAAACQAIWLRELLAEVTGLERKNVIIRVDNKSAITLSKNPVFHGRSKRIHTRYHFIRECVENEKVMVKHVSREYQRADPLTKALVRIRFKEMRSLLGVQELPSSTQKFRGVIVGEF